MHDVERTLRGDDENYKHCITPTSADTGANAFRSWWKKVGLASSPPHSFGPASSGNLSRIPRAEYTNPWHMHTKSCSHCQNALRRARKMQKWSLIVGFVTSLSTNISGRRHLALVIATIALAFSSIGNKVVRVLEGPRHLSDVPDRSIPL